MARAAVLVSLTTALGSPKLSTMERPGRAVEVEMSAAPSRGCGGDGTVGPRGRGTRHLDDRRRPLRFTLSGLLQPHRQQRT
jgi:hypothetical protein